MAIILVCKHEKQTLFNISPTDIFMHKSPMATFICFLNREQDDTIFLFKRMNKWMKLLYHFIHFNAWFGFIILIFVLSKNSFNSWTFEFLSGQAMVWDEKKRKELCIINPQMCIIQPFECAIQSTIENNFLLDLKKKCVCVYIRRFSLFFFFLFFYNFFFFFFVGFMRARYIFKQSTMNRISFISQPISSKFILHSSFYTHILLVVFFCFCFSLHVSLHIFLSHSRFDAYAFVQFLEYVIRGEGEKFKYISNKQTWIERKKQYT